MIGVIGATGMTGNALVGALKGKGADFRCLVRDTAKAAETLGTDVAVVQADLADAASIEAGMQGCDKLFLLSGHSPVMVEQQLNAVNAAKAVGVSHIVKLSGGSFIITEDTPALIGRGHWQIEQEIRASGLDWTFLRPGFFMQNFLNMAEAIKAMSKVMMPVPADINLGMIDVRDTADVAAVVLTTEGHAGQVYELSGPNVTPAEAVAAIGSAIGKVIDFIPVPMEGAIGAMKERGMPDWLVDHQSTLMGLAAEGNMATYGNDLIEKLAGHAPRTPADFARDHAGAFTA
ncbi:MAG: SDR family oxidoreductase [Alphaproteobacteria bacterium]|nr:SDR family oxidoreductase [Alphaproteobacteria bacterium]